jgi:hemin uptake protein HemP
MPVADNEQSDNEQSNHKTFAKKANCDRTAAELNLPKIISFNSLVRCGDEVWIENEGQIYRLRRTKQGKLVLTK